MKNQEFNRYCADVMGYTIHGQDAVYVYVHTPDGIVQKNYDDLNQMAEVVEKLTCRFNDSDRLKDMFDVLINGSIKQAFRDFIISTMDKK
jgi:hypothetical protein